ncbi:MAG: hypothetical protein ABMA64_32525 [Myxococcota bacterium]
MSWRDLLSVQATITVPWTGSRTVVHAGRTYQVHGALPPEHGFHTFTVGGGRRATWSGPSPLTADAYFDDAAERVTGYLLGDRIAPDGAAVAPDLARLVVGTERVHLVEPGLDRYARIVAARAEDGRLVWLAQDFPLGPEDEVREAFLAGRPSVDHVRGVTPALDLAFRLESWMRDEAARRRAELEARRAAEVAAELRHQRTAAAATRRRVARDDFDAAATEALAVTGAELISTREGYERGEHVVRFRFVGRSFECVCDGELRIVDAGICLVDHFTGERGDTRFTLESLPAVIREADRDGKLVQFRR